MKACNAMLKLVKEKYPYLSAEFGVVKIGVFGSIAKGIEKEDSDIDIVVELKRPIGLKFIELVEYLENLFHKKVDVLTQDGIENIRIKEVAEDIKRNIIYV
ncbi:MAG: nucleotidyltransferase domain-containing protein [Planctomycetes bacterium]|uniref:nucleotidyltransferase family protein n=1 Tax=Candidatus Wunengus sp. YC65 TaxID=3367701 RepID=UPI001D9CFBA6|nr:nucleotidyltransferase domain-containing protein [Planctomycetota bacterium]